MTTLDDDALSRLRRKSLGFVFQFFNLVPVLTARENVAMPLILDGVSRAEALKRADEVAGCGSGWRTADRIVRRNSPAGSSSGRHSPAL